MARSLRLAVHNPFHPQAFWAERELALRTGITLERLGWDYEIIHRAADLEAFAPDAALCLHPQMVPKMTAVPSLGCHWNPPGLFRHNEEQLWRNGLSHDAFLTGSPFLADLLQNALPEQRQVPMQMFYPSTQGWALPPQLSPDSRFFYIGSNWDGNRYPLLLEQLANSGMLALYGQKQRWQHMQGVFAGSLPFDGHSVLEQANACGMGLCLHLPDHFTTGTPNMRVFELCAAGALIISDRHRFVVENFGDCVLYVDMSAGEESVAQQIIDHGHWARKYLGQGRDMARQAQEIFLEKFSLDRLLSRLPDLVKSMADNLERGQSQGQTPAPVPVSVITAPAGLAGLMAQTLKPAEVIICGQAVLPASVRAALPDTVLVFTDGKAGSKEKTGLADASDALRRAVSLATQEYVIWLEEGDELFPDYLAHFELARTTAASPPDLVLADGLQQGQRPLPIPSEQATFVHPFLDWQLLPDGCTVPTALMVRRHCLLAALAQPLLSEKEPAKKLGQLLGQRLSAGQELRGTGSVTIRISGTVYQDQQPGKPDGIREELAWTGASDLAADSVRDLPRLRRPSDFTQIPSDCPCYIYGASRGGELLFHELSNWKNLSVAGFIDSLWEGEFEGFPVRKPENIDQEELRGAIIIFANQYVSSCFRKIQDQFPQEWGQVCMFNGYPYILRCLAADSLGK